MERVHYDITVRGRVQGVFFRHSAARLAEELGLAGSARNEPDGSVGMAVEGPKEAADRFVAWCRTGPPDAEVTRVEVTPGEPEGLAGFGVH